jgi:hypothetical protein
MDPDPSIFIIDLQDANQKIIFFTKFFCILLFEGTFTSFFKGKMSKRSRKTVEIKVFLTIFAYPDPGGPKIRGSGSGFRSGSATTQSGRHKFNSVTQNAGSVS